MTYMLVFFKLHVPGQNWGRVDKSRFNCCFICVDAATPVLDRYVEQRVDCMIDAGLLDEVYDIYNVNGDYTRGLRQAIGVREFEEFLKMYLSTIRNNGTSESIDAFLNPVSTNTHDETLKEHMRAILKSSGNNQLKILLEGAIDKVKLNTRRLIRIQVSIYSCLMVFDFIVDGVLLYIFSYILYQSQRVLD